MMLSKCSSLKEKWASCCEAQRSTLFRKQGTLKTLAVVWCAVHQATATLMQMRWGTKQGTHHAANPVTWQQAMALVRVVLSARQGVQHYQMLSRHVLPEHRDASHGCTLSWHQPTQLPSI